jgi:hypothetical protein
LPAPFEMTKSFVCSKVLFIQYKLPWKDCCWLETRSRVLSYWAKAVTCMQACACVLVSRGWVTDDYVHFVKIVDPYLVPKVLRKKQRVLSLWYHIY